MCLKFSRIILFFFLFSTPLHAQIMNRPVISPFSLLSHTLPPHGMIQQQQASHSCSGFNQSPDLLWNNPPIGTQSFAILAYDIDMNVDGVWWVWVVSDIPAETRFIAAGSSRHSMPLGSQEFTNDSGTIGFELTCPQDNRTHRYRFFIYALDIPKLNLTENQSTPNMVNLVIRQHSLAKAIIQTNYRKAQAPHYNNRSTLSRAPA